MNRRAPYIKVMQTVSSFFEDTSCTLHAPMHHVVTRIALNITNWPYHDIARLNRRWQ